MGAARIGGSSAVGGAAQQENPAVAGRARQAVALGEGACTISQIRSRSAGLLLLLRRLRPLDGLRLRSVLLVREGVHAGLPSAASRRLRRRGIAERLRQSEYQFSGSKNMARRTQTLTDDGLTAIRPSRRPFCLLVPGVPVPCAVQAVGLARGPSRGGGRSASEERAQRPECQSDAAASFRTPAA